MAEEARKFYEYLKMMGRSGETAYHCAWYVHNFIKWLGRDVRSVTREDLFKYIEYLSSVKKYSGKTIRNISYALSQFLSFLGMDSLAKWVPRPAARAEEVEWLDEETVSRVIDSDPVLVVAYELALRLSELLMLRRDEYDRDSGVIAVYRLKHKGKPNRYVLKLSDRARRLLNMYIDTHACPDNRVFCMSRRAVQARFKRALKRAGLDPGKYTFHVLRHSRCTNLVIRLLKEKGYVDVVVLSKFMGHLDPSTTMSYIHIASRYLGIEKPIELL